MTFLLLIFFLFNLLFVSRVIRGHVIFLFVPFEAYALKSILIFEDSQKGFQKFSKTQSLIVSFSVNKCTPFLERYYLFGSLGHHVIWRPSKATFDFLISLALILDYAHELDLGVYKG